MLSSVSPGGSQEIPSWKQKRFWFSVGSCEMHTYPRGHSWGANVFPTTIGESQGTSPIRTSALETHPVPPHSVPFKSFHQDPIFPSPCKKSEQGGCNEGCCLFSQRGARATPERVKLDIRKNFFIKRSVKPWHRLSRAAVESPSP